MSMNARFHEGLERILGADADDEARAALDELARATIGQLMYECGYEEGQASNAEREEVLILRAERDEARRTIAQLCRVDL